MSDLTKPYLATSYRQMINMPRTPAEGPHSEGKKPYATSDYLEMELLADTFFDSPYGSGDGGSGGLPVNPDTISDPCGVGFTLIGGPGTGYAAGSTARVYWVIANPRIIAGCSGVVSEPFSLTISPDFKCPKLFLFFCGDGPEVLFNGEDMCSESAQINGFTLYTRTETEDGDLVQKAGGNITISFDCGNRAPWLMFAVGEECPCPGDPLIYSTVAIWLDQCPVVCSTCADPNCDDCPLTIGGGPAEGRASLSTSYNYTLTGAVGNVVWTTSNAGTTLSNQSSTGVTLNVLSTACDYNNGAITLTATNDRGENVCTKTESAQAGTWVLIDSCDNTATTSCWSTSCAKAADTCTDPSQGSYESGLYKLHVGHAGWGFSCFMSDANGGNPAACQVCMDTIPAAAQGHYAAIMAAKGCSVPTCGATCYCNPCYCGTSCSGYKGWSRWLWYQWKCP